MVSASRDGPGPFEAQIVCSAGLCRLVKRDNLRRALSEFENRDLAGYKKEDAYLSDEMVKETGANFSLFDLTETERMGRLDRGVLLAV